MNISSEWLDSQISGVMETLAGEENYDWRRYWSGYLTALQSVQRKAQAIEAQRAGTTKIDPVHESAVVADDAPIIGMGKSDQEGA